MPGPSKLPALRGYYVAFSDTTKGTRDPLNEASGPRLYWLLFRGLMGVFLKVIIVLPIPPSLNLPVQQAGLRRTKRGSVRIFIFPFYNCITPSGLAGTSSILPGYNCVTPSGLAGTSSILPGYNCDTPSGLCEPFHISFL